MKKEKSIYDTLERLRELRLERESSLDNLCPVYSPSQECVGMKCVWFDARNMECWVLNPKPKPEGPG